MARLILEITNRHGRQIHRVDRSVLRVGRAWDNDIIIADPTVSPYHFVIRSDPDGEPAIYSLADENGLRIGGRPVEGPITLTGTLPTFFAGRTRIRVVDPSQAVPATRLIGCRSGSCLFGSWTWALVLFALYIVVSLIENYLATPDVLSWKSFGKDQLTIVGVALTMWLGLVLLNRITAQHSDYAAALSMVSLMMLAAIGLDYLVAGLNYYLSSPAPVYFMDVAWYLVLAPLALAWFLIRLNHARPAPAVMLIVLLISPLAFVHSQQMMKYTGWFDTFSKRAYFSQELAPHDVRQQQTISVSAFIDILDSEPGARSR